MTQIIDSTVHTYDNGLGWVNTEALPAGSRSGNLAGRVFRWMTKGGLPLMVPDQWAEVPENPDVFEPLPKGTKAITIDGDLVAV